MSACRARHAAGFTLVEVLVGTTLFGLLTTVLASGLFISIKSAATGEAVLESIEDERLLARFLRDRLAQMTPLTQVADGGRSGQANRVAFVGRPDRLRFVTHLPAHRGGGGLQVVELFVGPEAAGGGLMIAYRNAWPEPARSMTESTLEWQHESLTPDVVALQVDYFGRVSEDASAGWQRQWDAVSRLPALVKLKLIHRDGVTRPPLVIDIAAPTMLGQPHLGFLDESAR